ncbi:hypothetical protein ACFVOR_37355 [Streptomyces sp. NPDC057837]|uniref:hypothetical protein n=1 Tax=Streptomyces sp. NPDC057837 TaxID=3346260 RepID=UPI00368FC215
MTITSDTTRPDTQHHFLAGLAQQGRYAHDFARSGRAQETAEDLQAIERQIAAYRAASGDAEDIHTYFGLSYANYLVLPRTLLQSMPAEWQHRFVGLVNELHDAFEHVKQAPTYQVLAGETMPLNEMTDAQLAAAGIDSSSRVAEGSDEDDPDSETVYHRRFDGAELTGDDYGFVPGEDPVPHYNRGRTRVEPRVGGAA